MNRYQQVMTDHLPAYNGTGRCGECKEVQWTPEHVLEELKKVGFSLVSTAHMVAYVEAANRFIDSLNTETPRDDDCTDCGHRLKSHGDAGCLELAGRNEEGHYCPCHRRAEEDVAGDGVSWEVEE